MIEVVEIEPKLEGPTCVAEHGNCAGHSETPEGALMMLACAVAEELADDLGVPHIVEEVPCG